MKGGKKKNSATDTLKPPSEAAGASSDGVSENQGEALQKQKHRYEAPEDASGEEEPVAVEEEEKDEEGEENLYEEFEEEEGDGDGDGEADDNDNEKPKLAEGYYEIEAVRRKRIRKGQVQYLIKWRGWPETANTWEPVKNLMSCSDVIEAFEESLQPGKQRSTRKRKRKAVTQTPPKKKQQQQQQQHQSSPAAATYNVPAVKVRIIEEPTPSPLLSSSKATNHVDSNGSGLNNNEVDKVVNSNGLKLGFSLEKTREQNELNLKLSELKGAVSTNDSVQKYNNGLSNGFPKASGVESFQSDRCTGAKRRKSGSVRRFKQDTASVMNDIQDAAAVGPITTFIQEGTHNHEFVGSGLVWQNKFDDSKDAYAITQILKPISYSTSLCNDVQDVSVTFLAKRSDGKEMMVDNKFLKMNNPLLLINFYEQHLRYQPTQ